jgi:signal peptidase II
MQSHDKSRSTVLQLFKRYGLLAVVGGGVLALDQLIKWLVVRNLALGQAWEEFPDIAGGILRITRSHNTGAAFGMFPFASTFFLVLALVTVVAFIVSYPRLPSHAMLSRLSVAMISGGALSNAIDRLRYGYVVDYVHVQLSSGLANISNFADHAITVGVILLLVDQWRAERNEARQRAASQAAQEADDAPVLLAEGGEAEQASAGTAAAEAEEGADQSGLPVDRPVVSR